LAEYRSGFVAIMGSPNVGKSTLLNQLVGMKIAIVTSKAQTTRNKVSGILTRPDFQIVFLDTPGIHTPKNRLGEYMVKTAYSASREVDAILLVLDARVGLPERDTEILKRLKEEGVPLFVILNKKDIADAGKLDDMRKSALALGIPAQNILPISALTGDGVEEMVQKLYGCLMEGPQYYPEDMVTDRPERFIAAEMIREKALLNLREEIPHGVGVEIESFEEEEGLVRVGAVLYCERPSHKGILIGKGGSMLKKIGAEARKDLQMLVGTRVYLELWVKVKKDWRNSEYVMNQLGYRKEEL